MEVGLSQRRNKVNNYDILSSHIGRTFRSFVSSTRVPGKKAPRNREPRKRGWLKVRGARYLRCHQLVFRPSRNGVSGGRLAPILRGNEVVTNPGPPTSLPAIATVKEQNRSYFRHLRRQTSRMYARLTSQARRKTSKKLSEKIKTAKGVVEGGEDRHP